MSQRIYLLTKEKKRGFPMFQFKCILFSNLSFYLSFYKAKQKKKNKISYDCVKCKITETDMMGKLYPFDFKDQ